MKELIFNVSIPTNCFMEFLIRRIGETWYYDVVFTICGSRNFVTFSYVYLQCSSLF